MNWQSVFEVAFGAFCVSMALVTTPNKNWISNVLFKLAPFFGGLALLLIGLGVV